MYIRGLVICSGNVAPALNLSVFRVNRPDVMSKMLYVPDNLMIFEGFYDSNLYNSDMEYNYNYELEEGEPECEIDDWDEYRKDVCIAVTDTLRSYMCNDDEICTSVEYAGLSSPRYYNFSTDKIELDVEIDLDKLKDWVMATDERKECFNSYLREKYTSYDGFMSFVDNNVDAFFSEGGSFEEYPDVLIDYYVLTHIYETDDIVEAAKHGEHFNNYHWEIYEAADEIFYMHMAPIESETEDTEETAEAQ